MRRRNGARRNGETKIGRRNTRRKTNGHPLRRRTMTPPGMPRAMAAMVATATAGNPRVPLLQLGMMIGALAGGSKTAGATGRGPWTSPPPLPPRPFPLPAPLRRKSPLWRPPSWSLLLCKQCSPPGLRRLLRLLLLRLASPSASASWSCSSSSSNSSGSAWPKRGCGVLGQNRPRADVLEGPTC